MDRQIRAGTWSTREGVQLRGKTLGIIGLGGIGREVMRIGRGLGMEVIAWNRTRHADAPLVELERTAGARRRHHACILRSMTRRAAFSARRSWRG